MWGKYSVTSLPTEKTQMSSSQPVIKTASKQYFVLINYPDKHQNFNEVIPLPVRHKENRKHKYNLHVIKMYLCFLSGQNRGNYDSLFLTIHPSLFPQFCHYLPLYVTSRHYSYYSRSFKLFAIHDYSLLQN